MDECGIFRNTIRIHGPDVNVRADACVMGLRTTIAADLLKIIMMRSTILAKFKNNNQSADAHTHTHTQDKPYLQYELDSNSATQTPASRMCIQYPRERGNEINVTWLHWLHFMRIDRIAQQQLHADHCDRLGTITPCPFPTFVSLYPLHFLVVNLLLFRWHYTTPMHNVYLCSETAIHVRFAI